MYDGLPFLAGVPLSAKEPPSGGDPLPVARGLDPRARIGELHRLTVPGASGQREVRVFCGACLFPRQNEFYRWTDRVGLRGRVCFGLSPRTEASSYPRREPAEAGWILLSSLLPRARVAVGTSHASAFRRSAAVSVSEPPSGGDLFFAARRFDLRAGGPDLAGFVWVSHAAE